MTELQQTLDKIWPGWTIEESLGKGAYGTVYRIVREDKFGHKFTAALKVIIIPDNEQEYRQVIYEGLDEESATDYFQGIVEDVVDEIVLMSQLKGNTNIVSYEDHTILKSDDSIQWKIFIRMELLTPLYDYMRDHELSIRDVIRLGIEMCNALELCQRYNIIHRDIKPDNIFVSDIGRFKLGDFGIARQLEKTSTGLSKKGTHSYMAPEVYKGEAYNSTVDIYSLGMVLYRLLNNNRGPFMPPYPERIRYSDRERANILRMSGTAMPYPAKAEGRLGEIILKACSYEPDKRYESAIAMREALESVAYEEQEKELIYPAGDGLENQDKEDEYISDVGINVDTDISTVALLKENDTAEGFMDEKEADISEGYNYEVEENLDKIGDGYTSEIQEHTSYLFGSQGENGEDAASLQKYGKYEGLNDSVNDGDNLDTNPAVGKANGKADKGMILKGFSDGLYGGEQEEGKSQDKGETQGKIGLQEDNESLKKEYYQNYFNKGGKEEDLVSKAVGVQNIVYHDKAPDAPEKKSEKFDGKGSIFSRYKGLTIGLIVIGIILFFVVYIVVSKGKRVQVPYIIHLSVKEAEKKLIEGKLKMDTGKDRKGGYILSQGTGSGSLVEEGSKIKVETSDGPKPETKAKAVIVVNYSEDDYETNKKELDPSKTILLILRALRTKSFSGSHKTPKTRINTYYSANFS